MSLVTDVIILSSRILYMYVPFVVNEAAFVYLLKKKTQYISSWSIPSGKYRLYCKIRYRLIRRFHAEVMTFCNMMSSKSFLLSQNSGILLLKAYGLRAPLLLRILP